MPGDRPNLETHQGTVVVRDPPHFPTMYTRETVTNLAAFGLTENQMAVILKCTPEDVRSNYSAEIEHGLARVNAQVQAAVLHAAIHERDVAAMKLWLVNKAGWRTGDGPRGLPKPGDDVPADGEYTVVERREVLTRILSRVVQDKRNAEKVIDGRVVATAAPAKPNGTNGAKKTNGNGNGSGHT